MMPTASILLFGLVMTRGTTRSSIEEYERPPGPV